MLHTVPREDLDALVQHEPRALSDALEQGRIVYFPSCPIALPEEAELSFLREEIGPNLRRKNVSWYFDRDRVKGLETAPVVAERAHRLLREHAARVRELLTRAMPEFSRGWTPGTTSVRPFQEKGRALSAHASNELVHVDAGAYGATHGDRVLRFFVNINPREDRVWVSRGAFPELFAAHGREAGIAGEPADPIVGTPMIGTQSSSPQRGRNDPVREGPFDRAFTSVVNAGARLAPALKMIDSSPYDRLMRRFHNWMKDTPSFRDSQVGLQTFRFPPLSAWMVLTDQVSHACIEGQHALIDTFIVPLANCRLRELSPYEILRAQRAPDART